MFTRFNPRVPHTDVILICDLEVNRLTHEVRRSGQSIELTAREYALLEYLLSSPDLVFSRSMILEHVWDPSFEGVANIVEVHVRHLRQKVDDPFQVKLIHTVRGVGYCVRETPCR
jgi:DNA-binding response OmpR family regulator